MFDSLSQKLRRLTMNSHFFFALKVMVAILGTLVPALVWDMTHETVSSRLVSSPAPSLSPMTVSRDGSKI